MHAPRHDAPYDPLGKFRYFDRWESRVVRFKGDACTSEPEALQ